MINRNRVRLSHVAVCMALALVAAPAIAQNTTSAIAGRITGTDGKPATGAQVTILHVESGSVNIVMADAEGRYNVRGLRVGGPYTITITQGGVVEKRENVYLQLAETASLDAKLGAKATSLDTIVVTGKADASDKFSNTAMGAGTNVSRADLDAFASIQRNLQDYARLDPRVAQTDKERGEVSVGGQNSRFNKITVDGVNISDTFGLEANGLPTAKQPISIDAIQSVQVNVSNYDVTQTGYTGGGINAVTKSGTNDFKGTLTNVYREPAWSGKRYSRATDVYTAAPLFTETTRGITLGGPIIKDTLFFFLAYEEKVGPPTRGIPVVGPIGSSLPNVIGITPTAIASAQSIGLSKYGIDIGTSDIPQTQLKVKDELLKLDWNISANHRANVRYTKTEQSDPLYSNFFATGTTALALSSHFYQQNKTIETVVGQWFADWSPTFSTEFKVSQRDYNSEPKNAANLPQIQLGFTGAQPGIPNGTRNLFFGTEQFRHYNRIETNTLDGYFGANWTLGVHELKFASDYQDNKVFNAFLPNSKGTYAFNCESGYAYTFGTINCGTATAAQVEAAVLENFSRGRPSSYQLQVPALPGGTLADGIARFHVTNIGFALQDSWAVNPNLTLLLGARLDTPSTNQKPLRNASVAVARIGGSVTGNAVVRETGGFGLDNTTTIDGQNLFQPRVGFNYTFDSKRPMQLRGGFGLFQGASPTVWLSNVYTNAGVAVRTVTCSTNGSPCPRTDGFFSADPNTQPTSFTGSVPASNVDLWQSGLAQPSVWKANLGFEHELPWWGMVASVEYLYTKTNTGLYYQHLNLGAPTRAGSDGREIYYNPIALNPACWTSIGNAITTGACAVPAGARRDRALSNVAFGDVTLATKTKGGGGNLASVSLSGQAWQSLKWTMAYTYTDATEVSNLQNTIATSSYRARASFNPNENVSANSSYLVKDRFNGSLSWSKALFDKTYKTTVGLFYEGRAGKPYSWTFSNDANGDGYAGNDLMYIPKAPGSGEVVFAGDTATDKTNENRFWAIVNSDKVLRGAAGSVVKRNANFSPWSNSVDMRLSQQLPGFVKGHKAVFTLDLLNVGNALNKRWGRIDEIPFSAVGGERRTFVNFAGIDAQGRYVYAVKATADDFVTRQQRGESQWALQATIRYEF